MKNRFYTLLLLVNSISIYGINYKEINISLNASDFPVRIINGIVYIESNKYLCGYGGNTDEPALPHIGVNVLIGRDDIYNGFTYSTEEEEILKGVTIINNTEEIPTSKTTYSITKPSISYSRNSYPNTLIKNTGLHEVDGYKYVSFLISPFRYDNLSKTLYFENNISISLQTLTNVSQRRENNFHSKISQDKIRDFVVNGEDVSSLYPTGGKTLIQTTRTNTQYEYIIITKNSLKSIFLKLADWKTRKGIRTKVLTTEEICSTYSGVSDQQKIKAAIKAYYDNSSNLKYVLLAGDVDIVPAQIDVIKYLPNETTSYVSNCPVDLFYANFDTMDWDYDENANNDGQNNLNCPYPQIAVTRAPVSSVSDAETFVDRIIDYEASPNIESWSNNILMCGNKLNVNYTINDSVMSDAHYKGETFYTNYISPYWSGSKISFFDTGTDIPEVTNYSFIPQNIQQELSKGYTFVNMTTHGSPTVWKTAGSNYSVNYANNLNNSNHTVIVTTACLTNAFDSIPECLSESFIRNQQSDIVSYFGCSRYGWSNSNINRYGTSEKVNRELYRIMFNDNEKSFGEIVRQTKVSILSHCSNYDTPYRWLLFGLNPIGDPEMPIFINTPQKFTNVIISYANGELTVDSGVNDCKICVASANDMGDSYYEIRTGMYGTFSNLTGEYSICVTKAGYVPYLARCGNTVYMQNESINTDYIVLSNQTLVGNDVTISKPNGPVEINKGNVIIKGSNGVTINDCFEVKRGAILEIR